MESKASILETNSENSYLWEVIPIMPWSDVLKILN